MDTSILPEMYRLESQHWWFRARLELTASVTADCVPAGSRLLDIGCGTGLFLERVREQYDGWGLDPSPAAVAYCGERGLGQVRQGSIEQLVGATLGPFDAVTMWDVLEHVEGDRSALAAVRAALRPGGTLLLTVPAYQWLWSQHDVVHHHYRRYSRSTLNHVLRESGFRVDGLTYYNSWLFPLALAERIVSRLLRRTPSVNVPPAVFNEFFCKVFKSERRQLKGRSLKGFPTGLSLIAVATST
jgi:2-polyprenyl-3-methyl-5-hydroxy-6-metoxy-1,4-benzoquinol methylase